MADEREQPLEEAIPPAEEEKHSSEPAGEQEAPEEKKEQPDEVHVPPEKKGRLIAAGLIATVTVSFLALAVAGLVQINSRWLIVCPADPPVNDPAPLLWKAAVSGDTQVPSLGVSEDILEQSRFKQK